MNSNASEFAEELQLAKSDFRIIYGVSIIIKYEIMFHFYSSSSNSPVILEYVVSDIGYSLEN